MRRLFLGIVKPVCFALVLLYFIPTPSFAVEQFARSGFWGGIDVGVGWLQQSLDEIDVDDTDFFLGFKAGYTLNPHLMLGLELSGWLLEETNLEDPAVGEGISQIFLISRYYPIRESNFFTKIGGGYANIWNNRPGETRRKNGWGLVVGAGYDFPTSANFALSPFVTFSYGDAEDLTYKAVNFGIGLTLQ
jgi:hypothetical protein